MAAGTWHHTMFSFRVFLPTTADPSLDGPGKPQHTYFYADGLQMPGVATVPPGWTGTPSDDSNLWPTEIHAQAQVVGRVIQAMLDELDKSGMFIINQSFDPEQYRHAVQVPLGTTPVWIGKETTPSPIAVSSSPSGTYMGLVDNLICQGGYCKRLPVATGPTQAPAKFDVWRPTLGKRTTAADDNHLTFRKHTPALEWDKPIRIVSYEWTAWKQGDDGQNFYLDLGLV